jgi:hypothetical protein
MDMEEPIRVRVIAENFYDIPPVQKEQLLARKALTEAGEVDATKMPMTTNTKSPYSTTVCGCKFL